MTGVGAFAIAGRVVSQPRGSPCSAVTTSAMTTGTASATWCPVRRGGTASSGNDTRLFVDAIRYLAKTGIGWADLPTCFGKANSLWHRYDRWCRNGVWETIAAALRDDDTEWLSVDSSCVRATVAAAGAKKNGTVRAVRRPRGWVAGAGGMAAKSTAP